MFHRQSAFVEVLKPRFKGMNQSIYSFLLDFAGHLATRRRPDLTREPEFVHPLPYADKHAEFGRSGSTGMK